MSEISPSIPTPASPSRPILLGVIYGLVLAVPAALIAIVMSIAGLVLFNGCFGTSNPLMEIVMMGWIFVLWPLSAVGAAVSSAVTLARGRGWKKALRILGVGSLISIAIYLGWLVVGSIIFC